MKRVIVLGFLMLALSTVVSALSCPGSARPALPTTFDGYVINFDNTTLASGTAVVATHAGATFSTTVDGNGQYGQSGPLTVERCTNQANGNITFTIGGVGAKESVTYNPGGDFTRFNLTASSQVTVTASSSPSGGGGGSSGGGSSGGGSGGGGGFVSTPPGVTPGGTPDDDGAGVKATIDEAESILSALRKRMAGSGGDVAEENAELDQIIQDIVRARSLLAQGNIDGARALIASVHSRLKSIQSALDAKGVSDAPVVVEKRTFLEKIGFGSASLGVTFIILLSALILGLLWFLLVPK